VAARGQRLAQHAAPHQPPVAGIGGKGLHVPD
jgi:hypothetical protein